MNSVVLSSDDEFLYATPWHAGAVAVFQRDKDDGSLRHVQTLSDEKLRGDTGFALNGDYAAAACFGAQSVVLMRRDPITGKLTIVDSAREGENDVEGLAFAIDVLFSPDGRYLYVLDGGEGGIATFAVNDGRLKWLNVEYGTNDCLAGSRGAAFGSGAKTLYVASDKAGTLSVLDWDEKTGRLKVRQVIKDEEGDVHGLQGAFGVTTSKSGEFIYTTSGRFQGDSAVNVFKKDASGKLSLVHEIIAGEEGLSPFAGGNRIELSPDEKNVYVAATRSGSVACFERDASSGKLKVIEVISGHDNGTVDGAAGIAVSQDGKSVYVAAEGANTISIYRRK